MFFIAIFNIDFSFGPSNSGGLKFVTLVGYITRTTAFISLSSNKRPIMVIDGLKTTSLTCG